MPMVGPSGTSRGEPNAGEMETAYDPDPDDPAHETYTGTVTR